MAEKRKLKLSDMDVRKRLAIEVHATHKKTQGQLAKELGISPARLSQIANGEDDKRRLRRGVKQKNHARTRTEKPFSMMKAERKALYKEISAIDKALELVKDGLIDYEIFRQQLVKKGEHGKAYSLVLQSLPLVEAATKIEALKEKSTNNFNTFVALLTPDKLPCEMRDLIEQDVVKTMTAIIEELHPGVVNWDAVVKNAGIGKHGNSGRLLPGVGKTQMRELRELPGKAGVYALQEQK